MLKVLYAASEAVPFVKTGGLADVAGSLPKELKQKGVDVRVVIPKYSGIKEEYRNNMEHIYDGEINVSWRKKYLGIDTIIKMYHFISLIIRNISIVKDIMVIQMM